MGCVNSKHLGENLFKAGNYTRAKSNFSDHYNEAKLDTQEKILLLFYFAFTDLVLKNYEASQNYADEAIFENMYFYPAYFNKGMVYFKEHKYDNALICFNQTLDIIEKLENKNLMDEQSKLIKRRLNYLKFDKEIVLTYILLLELKNNEFAKANRLLTQLNKSDSHAILLFVSEIYLLDTPLFDAPKGQQLFDNNVNQINYKHQYYLKSIYLDYFTYYFGVYYFKKPTFELFYKQKFSNFFSNFCKKTLKQQNWNNNDMTLKQLLIDGNRVR